MTPHHALCFVFLGALAACDHRAVEDPPVATIAGLAVATAGLDREGLAGRQTYSHYCEICHGETGAGDGFNADSLQPRPESLSARLATMGTDGLARHISRGDDDPVPLSRCPPYGNNLDTDEKRALSAHIERIALALDTPTDGEQP